MLCECGHEYRDHTPRCHGLDSYGIECRCPSPTPHTGDLDLEEGPDCRRSSSEEPVHWGMRHPLALDTRERAESRLRRACDKFLTDGGYTPTVGPTISEVGDMLQIEVWATPPADA